MLIVFAGYLDVSIRLFQFNTGWKMRLHLPLGTLHHQQCSLYFKLHSLRERIGFFPIRDIWISFFW